MCVCVCVLVVIRLHPVPRQTQSHIKVSLVTKPQCFNQSASQDFNLVSVRIWSKRFQQQNYKHTKHASLRQKRFHGLMLLHKVRFELKILISCCCSGLTRTYRSCWTTEGHQWQKQIWAVLNLKSLNLRGKTKWMIWSLLCLLFWLTDGTFMMHTTNRLMSLPG